MSGEYLFDINDFEKPIIQRLKIKHPKTTVEPFPEGTENYVLKDPNGAILVIFNSTTFSTPGNLDATGQDTNNQFQISVVTRDLRSHYGAYALIKSVIAALSGHRIGTYGVFPRRIDFAARQKTHWQYNLLFQINSFFENDLDEPT